MKKMLIVTMPDRSQWSIPVDVIARHRATHFAGRLFDGDIDRSLNEETIPLFTRDPLTIERWCEEMMDWDDVKTHAKQTVPANVDYHEGWSKGMKRLA